MTNQFEQRLDRRQFLKTALAVAGGITTFGVNPSFAGAGQEPAHWAFLSDTHIAGDPDHKFLGFCPYQNLREICHQIEARPPDGLVVTGDLARLRGHAEDYKNLRELVAPIAQKRPIHLATGNHDDRENLLHAFQKPNYPTWTVNGKHMLTVDAGPVKLIVLDSLLFVDLPWGRLGKGQRRWLEMYLHACDEAPVVLMLHHPVLGMDALWDAKSLLKIVKPMAKVKAIVYGHSHRFAFSEYEGIHLINLPATGFTGYSSQPVGWVEARLAKDEGLFTLHALEGNTRLNGQTTRLRWRS
ncbi:MAG: metallophosphoesterase [Sedimentisphaerales bacterium]|jgi:3',5'-cyclic AMP phosphodiesterase CpdA|nr:metallophosphoesterase [Sedimentisphaerales bacterium]HNY78226.1 metallophosphoesterase [Sedimentisphaerales bacterium]HOC65712.1 metallophosphoesterase [Sedimentisphaerales bacterium]HOH64372.1 metallophosphoesterase [Sedimentisphaerales bacterium]HPY51955.1 metallophosphoesterase [Sedimentisphaerales bacterium]